MLPAQSVSPATAIGQFLVAFSRVEHVLRMYVGYGLGLDKFGLDVFDSIVRPYDFAMLCSIVNKLASSLPQYNPEKENIEKLVKQCRSLNDERVRVAHGTWGWGLGTSHMSRNSLKTGKYYEDTSDLCALTEKALGAAQSLIDVLIKVRDDPPAS